MGKLSVTFKKKSFLKLSLPITSKSERSPWMVGGCDVFVYRYVFCFAHGWLACYSLTSFTVSRVELATVRIVVRLIDIKLPVGVNI